MRRKYKVVYRLKVKNMVYSRGTKKWLPSVDLFNNVLRSLWRMDISEMGYSTKIDHHYDFKFFKGHNAFKRACGCAVNLLETKDENGNRLYKDKDVVLERTAYRNGKRWCTNFIWEEN